MNIEELIKKRDAEGIAALIKEHNLTLVDSKIVPADKVAKSNLNSKSEFYDRRQLARKILLNSLN